MSVLENVPCGAENSFSAHEMLMQCHVGFNLNVLLLLGLR